MSLLGSKTISLGANSFSTPIPTLSLDGFMVHMKLSLKFVGAREVSIKYRYFDR